MYDFAQQFGSSARGGGFAGRAGGGRFSDILGYGDDGQPMQPGQLPQPPQIPTGRQPAGGGTDFFSQLAGLLGMPQQQAAAPKQYPQRQPSMLSAAMTRPAWQGPQAIAGDPRFGGRDVPSGFGAQAIYGAQRSGAIQRPSSLQPQSPYAKQGASPYGFGGYR